MSSSKPFRPDIRQSVFKTDDNFVSSLLDLLPPNYGAETTPLNTASNAPTPNTLQMNVSSVNKSSSPNDSSLNETKAPIASPPMLVALPKEQVKPPPINTAPARTFSNNAQLRLSMLPVAKQPLTSPAAQTPPGAASMAGVTPYYEKSMNLPSESRSSPNMANIVVRSPSLDTAQVLQQPRQNATTVHHTHSSSLQMPRMSMMMQDARPMQNVALDAKVTPVQPTTASMPLEAPAGKKNKPFSVSRLMSRLSFFGGNNAESNKARLAAANAELQSNTTKKSAPEMPLKLPLGLTAGQCEQCQSMVTFAPGTFLTRCSKCQKEVLLSIGKLTVTILSASSVVGGAVNPYVRLTMGSQGARTRIMKQNVHPIWNEEFNFRITDIHQTLTLQVMTSVNGQDCTLQVFICIHPILASANDICLGEINFPLDQAQPQLRRKYLFRFAPDATRSKMKGVLMNDEITNQALHRASGEPGPYELFIELCPEPSTQHLKSFYQAWLQVLDRRHALAVPNGCLPIKLLLEEDLPNATPIVRPMVYFEVADMSQPVHAVIKRLVEVHYGGRLPAGVDDVRMIEIIENKERVLTNNERPMVILRNILVEEPGTVIYFTLRSLKSLQAKNMVMPETVDAVIVNQVDGFKRGSALLTLERSRSMNKFKRRSALGNDGNNNLQQQLTEMMQQENVSNSEAKVTEPITDVSPVMSPVPIPAPILSNAAPASDVDEELIRLRQMVKQQQEQLTSLDETNKQLTEKHLQLLNATGSETAMEELRAENVKLRQLLEKSSESDLVERLKEALKQSKEECFTLQQKLDSQVLESDTQSHRAIVMLQETVDDLQAQVSSKQAEVDLLKSTTSNASVAPAAVSHQTILSLQNQVTELQNQLISKEDELELLHQQLTSSQERLMSDSQDAVVHRFQRRVAELEAELQKKDDDLNDFKTRLQTYTKTLTSKLKNISALDDQIKTLTETVQTLEAENAALKSSNGSSGEMQPHPSILQLQESNRELTAEVARLQNALNSVQESESPQRMSLPVSSLSLDTESEDDEVYEDDMASTLEATTPHSVELNSADFDDEDDKSTRRDIPVPSPNAKPSKSALRAIPQSFADRPNPADALTRARAAPLVHFSDAILFLDTALDGNLDEMTRMIQAGVDVNLRNAEGITALHCGACNGHTSLVDMLLKAGALVNARDQDGWTPLHGAACSGDLQVIDMLLAWGADCEARTMDGEMPVDLAATQEAMELLEQVRWNKYHGRCVRALFDYDPKEDKDNLELNGDEIAIKKGDFLQVSSRQDSSVNADEEPDRMDSWWQIITEDGRRGFVPAAFVQ